MVDTKPIIEVMGDDNKIYNKYKYKE